MSGFESILYLVPPGAGRSGGSAATRSGFAHALALARRSGGQLTMLGAVPGRMTGLSGRRNTGPRAGLAGWIREELDELSQRAAESGVTTESLLFHGSVLDEAIREVRRSRHDLVVKDIELDDSRGARPKIGLDERLVRRSPVPVFFSAPAQGVRLQRVLAAIDVETREDRSRARQLLRTASSLAETHGAELHVLHAWSVVGASNLEMFSLTTDGSRVQTLLGAVEQDRRDRVEALVRSEVQEPHTQVSIGSGRTLSVIRRYARTLQPDLVIVGHEGRGGLSGLFARNKAELLLANPPCAVLAVPVADSTFETRSPLLTSKTLDGHPDLDTSPPALADSRRFAAAASGPGHSAALSTTADTPPWPGAG